MNPVPPNQNINWSVVGTAVVTIVAAFAALFGFDFEPATQASIVSIITGLGSVITIVLHNVANPPQNREKLRQFLRSSGDEGMKMAKKIAPALLALLFVPGLVGCATIGDWLGGQGKAIQQGLIAVKGTQALYIAICVDAPVGVRPAICSHNAATVKSVTLKIVGDATNPCIVCDLVATYKAHGDVALLEQKFSVLIVDLVAAVNDTNARSGRASFDVVTTIQILQAVIQIGSALYAEIKAANNPTDAELDGLVDTIKAQGARILAS